MNQFNLNNLVIINLLIGQDSLVEHYDVKT